MFNSRFQEFEEDPFFMDQFRAHRDHVQHFTRSFSAPFGASVMPSLTDARGQGGRAALQPGPSIPRDMSQSLFSFGGFDNRDLMRNPFGMVDNMISKMRNRMDVTRDSENGNVNGHSFSSSSVMTYSKVGNEPPKVFQACSSTHRAPGGIKETRQALKDSESGLEKLSIGHHIQDRGHVMQKKYNNKTAEAEEFDDEWKQNVSQFKSDNFMSVKPRSIAFNQEQSHREQPKAFTEGEPESKGQ